MNVLVIEDQPITALGVERLVMENFDTSHIHIATTGKQALHKINEFSFQLVIMDIVLPQTDSHALLFDIMRLQSNCKVLIYSNNRDEVYAMSYVSMGASGYLNKINPKEDFVMAIKMILGGQLFLSERVIRNNINQKTKKVNTESPFKKLSKRELEFFNHYIKGSRIKDICGIMNVEQSTAATLKKRMMTKLGVDGMVNLINIANEFGYK